MKRKFPVPYREGFVYFVKPVGMAGPIKIGFTASTKTRIQQMMSWSPFRLELMAFTPGTMDDEQELHQIFSDHRNHGEWFNPHPDLLDYIHRVIPEQMAMEAA
jgi:hypothetical protein